jgi:hypothetical protein
MTFEEIHERVMDVRQRLKPLKYSPALAGHEIQRAEDDLRKLLADLKRAMHREHPEHPA